MSDVTARSLLVYDLSVLLCAATGEWDCGELACAVLDEAASDPRRKLLVEWLVEAGVLQHVGKVSPTGKLYSLGAPDFIPCVPVYRVCAGGEVSA